MMIVEKVMLLRSVGIFASVADEYLTDVAQRAGEVRLAAGETLFEKDDPGTMLYVIVNGRIRIHANQVTLAELGELETVGEMAALDPERRSASATAIDDTYLLSLSHRDIRELMEIDVEVAIGIVRVLCRRLRAANLRNTPGTPERREGG